MSEEILIANWNGLFLSLYNVLYCYGHVDHVAKQYFDVFCGPRTSRAVLGEH